MHLKHLLPFLLPTAYCLLPSPALAQSAPDSPVTERPLINLDTEDIPAHHQGLYRFEARIYGSREDLTYLHGGALYGLGNDLAAVLRVGGTPRRFFREGAVTLLHGGYEVEAGARLRLASSGDYRLMVQGSLLFPTTGMENSLSPAVEAILSRPFGDHVTAFLVPKAVFGRRTRVTLGGGVHVRLNDQWQVFGDIQGVLVGDNTWRVSTGNATRQEVWGVGFRYAPTAYEGKWTLDFGLTNGLGRTLSYSTQSALSGSAAPFFTLTYRP